MVKTPVEGNSIVILKMEKPVFFSDFARPICLPSSDEFIHMGAKCVTLGWSGQSKSSTCVLGGFQLEDLRISQVINHVTCYKFEKFICLKKSFTRFSL